MAAPLAADVTFPSVGFESLAGEPTRGLSWGIGTEISYVVQGDKIRVKLTDGRTFDFDNPNAAGFPFASSAGTNVRDSDGNVIRQLYIVAPQQDGVTLTYLRWASFGLPGPYGPTGEIIASLFLFGQPTQNRPTTGTATYESSVAGSAMTGGGTQQYGLFGDSAASFSANFGEGTVSTVLHLAGKPTAPAGDTLVDFGEFIGEGVITSAAFEGTFNQAGSGFWGSFFGPEAAEMGYTWIIDTDTFRAQGVVTGRKN